MKKIPPHAECVFKGVRVSVWQRQQEMFDGSFATFEVAKRFDSVQGVLISGDKIILPKELQPGWTKEKIGLFGGAMDDGEEALDAMKREMLEETGMKGSIMPWTVLRHGGTVVFDEYVYIMRDMQKIQEPETDHGGESIELQEFTFDEFLQEITKISFRNPSFAGFIIRNYILPNKKEELYQFFFGGE